MLWKIILGGAVSIIMITTSVSGGPSPKFETLAKPIKTSKLNNEDDLITAKVIRGEIESKKNTTPEELVIDEVLEQPIQPIINQFQTVSVSPKDAVFTFESKNFIIPSLTNFDLQYDNTWNFATFMEQSEYIGIKKRTITLTRGDTVITIQSEPRVSTGCEVLGNEPTSTPLISNILDSQISRYDANSGDYYAPSSDDHFDCEYERIFLVPSTLKSPETYKKLFNEDFIKFHLTATLNGTQFINEADSIIVNTLKPYEGY